MEIAYKDATISFDAAAVEAIAKQATGDKLQLACGTSAGSGLNSAQKKALKGKNVIGCYDIRLKCNNQLITDFGNGKVTVKVPLKLASGQEWKNVTLYHVDEEGKLTSVTITYESGYLTFTTTHFSIYAAVYDDDGTGLPKAEDGEKVNFRTLKLRLTRSGDTGIRLAWDSVNGADGYELYGARCNTAAKSYELVKIATLNSQDQTAWVYKDLKKNTYYKFVVRAYKLDENGEKVYLARSRSAHAATGGGTYGFISQVKVNQTKVTLKPKKTFRIRASLNITGQKLSSHSSLRYESNKPSVASVDSKGMITAKKKGTCYIYVYAQNGMYKRIKVTVE